MSMSKNRYWVKMLLIFLIGTSGTYLSRDQSKLVKGFNDDVKFKNLRLEIFQGNFFGRDDTIAKISQNWPRRYRR